MLSDPSERTRFIVSAVAVVLGIVAIAFGTSILGIILIVIAIANVGLTLSQRSERQQRDES